METGKFIKKYGEVAYKVKLQRTRDWNAQHHKERNAARKKWRENHPDKAKATNQEACCKGGKYYLKHLEYKTTGISGKKARIRTKHANHYRPLKKIIAPESQIHHEWIPGTADFRGVALVESNPHRYGIIDVIQILEGKITLLTEEEVKKE